MVLPLEELSSFWSLQLHLQSPHSRIRLILLGSMH
jgi:hypothetical protein